MGKCIMSRDRQGLALNPPWNPNAQGSPGLLRVHDLCISPALMSIYVSGTVIGTMYVKVKDSPQGLLLRANQGKLEAESIIFIT